MVSTYRDYQISVICMTVLSSLFIIVAFFGFFYRPYEIHEYGVVVDISSFDIELNLYRWKNRKTIQTTAQVRKKYTVSCDINVHTKILNSELLRENMFKCIRSVISQIENYELYNSTIFIYGTELTRHMCKSEFDNCNMIFGTITDVVNAFEMKVHMNNVKPLNGTEEALFGWISVNNYFNNVKSGRKGVNSYNGLDFKNYSVLISIETGKPFVSPSMKFNSTKHNLYGNNFDITIIDMMCYGVRQGYHRVLANLIKSGSSTWTSGVPHPCHMNNYMENIDLESSASFCYRPDKSNSKKFYRVNGLWNYEKCKNLIRSSLEEVETEQNMISYFDTELAEFRNRTFFGFSRIAEVANMIDFLRIDFQEFYDEAVDRCINGTNISYNYFCFDVLYMNVLLVEKLKVPAKNIIVGHKEKIETVTGSMVYHSRQISPRKAGCVIGKYGLAFVIFSTIVFSSLGAFLIKKMHDLKNDTMV